MFGNGSKQIYSKSMGKYPLTPEEKKRLMIHIHKLQGGKVQTMTNDYGQFEKWIKTEDPTFYRSIQHKLREAWEEFKRLATDILEGIGKAGAALTIAPAISIIEGVKEGFENGLVAGVEKGFDVLGKCLDDLFK